METTDLSREEQLSLFGLAKLIVQADAELSDGERTALKNLGMEMGRETFLEVIKEAQVRFDSRKSVEAHAQTIERPEARDYIYRRLLTLAEEDELLDEEQSILDWLKSIWNLS